MTKRLKVTILISILFLALIRLYPIWERYPGGLWNVLFYLIIATLFVFLIVKIVIEIVRIIRDRNNLNLKLFIPILIMIVSLTDGLFNPLKINLNSIYGQEVFRACYEGTQNQATLILRDDDKFDLHWTGVFFYDEFFVGKYSMNGDTIILEYKKNKPDRLYGKLIVIDENLFKIENDTLIDTHFYTGYCKGLN